MSESPAGPTSSIQLHFTAGNVAILLLFACACFHSMATYFYSYYRLIFGTLYPSYASYKAIKTKNIKEYARWMMFWVCFGLFSFVEIFSDLLFAWLPFYYEIKIIFILWLMSPYGNGARIMYKNVIHPKFTQHEGAIDTYIAHAKDVGVSSLHHLWYKCSQVANAAVLNLIQMTHAAILFNMERIASGEVVSQGGYRGFLPSILPSVLPAVPGALVLNSSNVSKSVGDGGPQATSQQLFDERMDYMTLDSDAELESNASSTNRLHIEELDTPSESPVTMDVSRNSPNATEIYDYNEELEKLHEKSHRSSPTRSRRSPSVERELRPARTARVQRTRHDAERPLIRPALVTDRYRARF